MADKLDVFMKMLEIIEKDQALMKEPFSKDEQKQIATIIEKLEGNVLIHQSVEGATNMTGDHIHDIKQSVIATGKSKASGKITNVTLNESGIKLDQLAEELSELRTHMRKVSSEPDHDIALGCIAAAEAAAKNSDETGVLDKLKSAGKWALQCAKDIGVNVAATAISKSLGL